MSYIPAILGLALSSAFVFSAGAADPRDVRVPPNPPDSNNTATAGQQAARLHSRGEFGVNQNIMQIHAAAFHPEYSSESFSYKGVMYWGPASVSGWAWAPLILPSGVVLDSLGLYAHDTDAGSNMTVHLLKTHGEDSATDPINPGMTEIASVSSSGSGGYGYYTAALNHTINNDARFSAEGGKYILEAYFPSASTSFSGVDIWWHRQISPAPVTATFDDVPTSHYFFQQIEALAASGITTGTTPTTFNPNGYITRAQMAAFLARALGLHFPH